MSPRKAKQEHTQVPIFEDGEEIFKVDEHLQSLIQFLWDLGLGTFNSCQDNVRDCAWIEYELGAWMLIVDTAFRSESDDLYRFIEEECEVLLLSCDDGELDENDEFWIEGENLIWSASVRFQKEHISDFEAMLRESFSDSDLEPTPQ